MATPLTGQISFSDLRSAFKDTNPILLSDYYKNNNSSMPSDAPSTIPNTGSSISIGSIRGLSANYNHTNYGLYVNTSDINKVYIAGGVSLYNGSFNYNNIATHQGNVIVAFSTWLGDYGGYYPAIASYNLTTGAKNWEKTIKPTDGTQDVGSDAFGMGWGAEMHYGSDNNIYFGYLYWPYGPWTTACSCVLKINPSNGETIWSSVWNGSGVQTLYYFDDKVYVKAGFSMTILNASNGGFARRSFQTLGTINPISGSGSDNVQLPRFINHGSTLYVMGTLSRTYGTYPTSYSTTTPVFFTVNATTGGLSSPRSFGSISSSNDYQFGGIAYNSAENFLYAIVFSAGDYYKANLIKFTPSSLSWSKYTGFDNCGTSVRSGGVNGFRLSNLAFPGDEFAIDQIGISNIAFDSSDNVYIVFCQKTSREGATPLGNSYVVDRLTNRNISVVIIQKWSSDGTLLWSRGLYIKPLSTDNVYARPFVTFDALNNKLIVGGEYLAQSQQKNAIIFKEIDPDTGYHPGTSSTVNMLNGDFEYESYSATSSSISFPSIVTPTITINTLNDTTSNIITDLNIITTIQDYSGVGLGAVIGEPTNFTWTNPVTNNFGGASSKRLEKSVY